MTVGLIIGGVAAAVRLMPAAWRRDRAAIALAAAGWTVWLIASSGLGQPLLAAASLAALGLAMLVARGALWRLALGQARPGVGGLQLGNVEIRIAAAWILSAAFLGVLALLLFVTLLCFAYAVAFAGHGFNPADAATWAPAVDERGRMVVSAVAIIGVAAMIYGWARISVAEVASVARGKIQVLSVWSMTRGRAILILVANAVIAVPPALVFLAGRAFATSGAGLLWHVAEAAVLAGVWLPMNVGLMAYVFETCTAQKPDL